MNNQNHASNMGKLDQFKEGMIGPAAILFSICFVMALLLALTNSITAPAIEAQIKDAVSEADFPGMPSRPAFEEIDVEALPEGVVEAFVASDRSYFVFKTATKGFGGDVAFFIGMDAQGNCVGIKMGEHTETPGLGSKIGDGKYLEQYYGETDPQTVDSVTGATITSNALRASLALCAEAIARFKGE